MRLLSIETSCDETSVAIIEDGRKILSNQIFTQIEIHKKYGGVVPEIASRNHVLKLPYVIDEALEKAALTWLDIDGIGVSSGPGLVGALLIGVSTAKAIAYALNKPLISVNHIEGHIAANYLQYSNLEPPLLALVTSGGHCNLILVKDYTDYTIIGRTRDDAAGEVFDKIARVLGFPYPGGVQIDKAAANGDPTAIKFPRVLLEKGSYDFSFSGLKSAVLNYLNMKRNRKEDIVVENVAASFQAAVIDVLVEKTIRCADEYNMKKICLAGGVSANQGLRESMRLACERHGYQLFYPDSVLCTDNAAMIGSMAYYNYQAGLISDYTLNACPNLGIHSDVLKLKGKQKGKG